MTPHENFEPISWDSEIFDIPCFEIRNPSKEALEAASRLPGHYTVRVDPLMSKKFLHEYGFYYADTLVEPYCTKAHFNFHDDVKVALSNAVPLKPLLDICNGAFSHGRFHRDFHLNQVQADARYNRWLSQLHAAGKVYGLIYCDELAGFMAIDGNKLVLHAISKLLHGRGLAKYLWTPVCRMLIEQGHAEVISSVSTCNIAVMNLYASLGFRFRKPVDIYHRLTQ